MYPSGRPLLFSLTALSLGGCAAATSGETIADSLSALRPQYVSTYSSPKSPAVFIRGATILTAAGPTLRNASILLRDGKIVELGPSLSAPAGATVVAATNKYVTPG